MKKIIQIFLVLFIGIISNQDSIAQGKPFGVRFSFDKVNGTKTKFPLYTSLRTKTPDEGGRARVTLFEGNPSQATVNEAIYRDAESLKVGAFYLTSVSDSPISFVLDYGFDGEDDDQRYHFDKVTYAVGDYQERSESHEVALSSTDIVYDCNLVDRNCYVYQRHSFTVPRNLIHPNPKKAYTKSLIIRYYKGNDNVAAKTMIMPIAVRGQYSEFIVEDNGPHQVKGILRAVPGDGSYSFMEKDNETSTQNTMSASLTNSKTKEESTKVEAHYSKYGVSGSASHESASSSTSATTDGNSNTAIFTFKNNARIKNDRDVDRYIVEAWKYNYFMQYDINANFFREDKIQMNVKSGLALVPTGKTKNMYLYEDVILKNIIDFRNNKREGDARFWEDLIAKNNELKRTARKIPGFESADGVEVSHTKENATSVSISQEIYFSKEKSTEITAKVGVDLGFVGGSVEAKTKTTLKVETTQKTENTKDQKKALTIGFAIEDDDNDKLNIELFEDRGFGSPVFKLGEDSETSCPYEGGIQIDKPSILTKTFDGAEEFSDSAKYSDIELGTEVIFTLKIKNESEAQVPRLYRVRRGDSNKRLPNMDWDETEFTLGYNAVKEIDVFVRNRFPTEWGYDEISMIVEPACANFRNWSSSGYVSDTIKLEAYWGATDKNRAPDNNFATSAIELPTDGSVQSTYLNKFDTESKLSNINATSSEEENGLVPPTDCQFGWCAETDGSPEITNSVWFKFVVDGPRVLVRMENVNDSFDHQLAAYSGGDPKDLSTFDRISSTDNNGIELNNLSITDTIYILVDGFQGSQGDFSMSVKTLAPRNDDACNPVYLQVNGQIVPGFTNVSATAEENEQSLVPELIDPIKGWNEDDIQHSVWFGFSAPPGGEVVIDVLNATFDAQIAVFFSKRICNPEYFPQLNHVGANDDITSSGGLDSRLHLKGLEDGTYIFMVDGFQGEMGSFDIKINAPEPTNDEPQNAIELIINAAGQGVFTNAGSTASDDEQVIAPPTVPLNKPGGWSDAPNDARARQVEHSVWFKFVAPAEGKVKISDCGQENFFSQLAVYKVGDIDDFNTYELLGADSESHTCRFPADNDHPNGRSERGAIVYLDGLTPDETYYLVVDGGLNSFGQFSLDLLTEDVIEPPVNDDACAAIALPVNGEVQTGYRNFAASFDKYEYKITPEEWLDEEMGGTVWFTFVAPATGEVEVSTCGLANFDTQLAVFMVEDCEIDSNFVLMGANEDGPASCATDGDSYLPLKNLTAGQTYYIAVDGYGGNRGNFGIVLNDQITPGPANDDVANAIELPVNGEVQTGYTNSFATVRDNEQNIRPKTSENQDCTTGWCDNQVDNSVWFKFVVPADGKVNISTCDLADFDTQLALYAATDINDFSTFTLKAANDAGPDDCATFFDSYLPVTGLNAGETYYIMVDGFDGDNGAFSISLTGVADVQAPSSPSDLSSSNITTESADVSWTAASDNVAVTEYEVYVDGTSVGKTASTSYSLTSLASSTSYTVKVVALDAAGNSSTASADLTITTEKGADSQAPTSPTDLTTTDIRATGADISWTAATDDSGIKEYKVYVDGTLTATVTGTTFSVSGLTEGAAYSIYVVAVDNAGNESAASTALKVTTKEVAVVDTESPSTPVDLDASEVSDVSMTLTWTASSDNVATTEYDIYVDGTLTASVSGTSYKLTGLSNAAAYSIYVIAKDAAGNVSGASTAIKVTTLEEEILAIWNEAISSHYKIYPNPFFERVILEYPDEEIGQGNVEIRNLVGQVLYVPKLDKESNGKVEINLSSLPSGMLFLVVKREQELIFRKLIKQ